MKERTAESLLRGLRQKFTLEATKSPNKRYSPGELSIFLREIMVNLDQVRLEVYQKEDYIENNEMGEHIRRSQIKRYDWKKFFGKPLTIVILKYRNEGFTKKETFEAITSNYAIKGFLELHPYERDKMIENIKISVNSRFMENKTAERVLEEEA